MERRGTRERETQRVATRTLISMFSRDGLTRLLIKLKCPSILVTMVFKRGSVEGAGGSATENKLSTRPIRDSVIIISEGDRRRS